MRIVLAALLLSTTAYAQAPKQTPPPAAPPSTAAQMHTDDCAKARAHKKDCIIDMTGTTIEGTGAGGGGFSVPVVDWGKAGSLIRLRKDFITEIIKTTEDL